MIEMKTFVSNGTIQQKKDFTHRMSESEYFRYKQNWWISLNKSGNTGQLRNPSDFKQALSTLTVYTKNLENDHSDRWFTGSATNGTNHIEFFLFGNGVDPGDLPKNSKKVDERGCMQRFMIER